MCGDFIDFVLLAGLIGPYLCYCMYVCYEREGSQDSKA